MTTKKVILDVDTGIDDALAIAYAMKSKKIDMLGLTTTFGNVRVEDATRNTQFVLHMLKENISVYEGSSHPLRKKELYLDVAKDIHGEDGLGNLLAKYKPVQADKGESDAVQFIIDTVKKYPEKVTLIFVGPLTNLAKIVKQAPEIKDLVEGVVIMGGAVTVSGNVTPYAEANIYADPEAAKVVFQSGFPITLVGLDVTMQTLLSKKDVAKWVTDEKEDAEFFSGITEFYIQAYERFQPGIGGCGLHDPLAVGVVLDSSFVKTKKMVIDVETKGETAGWTFEVEDGDEQKAIDVCLGVDVNRFTEHFLTTLSFHL